nr:flagellar basal body P-ring formation chaperone FlgA [uncultured Acinetobacter sp.]
MHLKRFLIFVLLFVHSHVQACTGLNGEQLIESANQIIAEHIESDQSSKLFPLFESSDRLYSQLTLKTSVYQPRVAFEVVDCEPLTGISRKKVLWFRPEIKMMAWVYKQNMIRNQPLNQTSFEYQEIDIIKEKISKSLLAVAPFNEDAWLIQSVKANTPILKQHLAKTPWVYRDQHVHVLAVSEGITIQTEGIAQQFGQYLDKVNVRLSSNHQLVRTTVIEKGTVKID